MCHARDEISVVDRRSSGNFKLFWFHLPVLIQVTLENVDRATVLSDKTIKLLTILFVNLIWPNLPFVWLLFNVR